MRWLEPALDGFPFIGRDDARDEIERKRLLDAARIAVNGKRDPLVAERHVRHAPATIERGGVQLGESAGDGGVVSTRMAAIGEHLVEHAVDFILIPHTSRAPSDSRVRSKRRILPTQLRCVAGMRSPDAISSSATLFPTEQVSQPLLDPLSTHPAWSAQRASTAPLCYPAVVGDF
jgi:hypothetical protein